MKRGHFYHLYGSSDPKAAATNKVKVRCGHWNIPRGLAGEGTDLKAGSEDQKLPVSEMACFVPSPRQEVSSAARGSVEQRALEQNSVQGLKAALDISDRF